MSSIPTKRHHNRPTRVAKIRRMINEGTHSVGDIARKVGVSRQYVYTTRYHMRKEQGLGAISNEVPAPTNVNETLKVIARVASYSPPAVELTGIKQPPSLWSRICAWFRN